MKKRESLRGILAGGFLDPAEMVIRGMPNRIAFIALL
jgi:hypothetical protein